TIIMTFAQGGYIISIVVAVRDQDYRSIILARFLFGITSFVTTLVACLWGGFEASLAASASVSLLIAGATLGWWKREVLLPSIYRGLQDWSAVRHYLMRYTEVNGGSLALHLAFHAASIGIVGLGVFSSAWSVVARIS